MQDIHFDMQDIFMANQIRAFQLLLKACIIKIYLPGIDIVVCNE